MVSKSLQTVGWLLVKPQKKSHVHLKDVKFFKGTFKVKNNLEITFAAE